MVRHRGEDAGRLQRRLGARRRRFLMILAVVVVASPSCARRAETGMVAMTVGDRSIVLEDFEAAFWEHVRNDPTSANAEGLRQFVPAFTKRILTEMVAREEIPELFGTAAERYEELSETHVVKAMRDEVYGAAYKVTDAELRRTWDMHGRKLRLRYMALPNEAEASLAVKALREGGIFQKIAEQRSLDARSAPSGGDLGWLTYADVDLSVRNEVFSLKVGEIGGPWQVGEHWQIFRAEEEAPNDARGTIDQERRMLMTGVLFERVRKARERYQEDLFAKYNFHMDPAQVAWMTALLHNETVGVDRSIPVPTDEDPEFLPVIRSDQPSPEPHVPPADTSRVIARFDHPDGRVTPGRVTAHLMTSPAMAWPRFDTPRDVERIIKEYALERLEYQEALARGLDKRPDISRELAQMKEEIRSRFFYRTRLRASAQFTDDDALRFYEANLAEFTRPERRRFQAVNTADRQVALRVAEMLRAGQTPEEIVQAFPDDLSLQSTGSRGTGLMTRGESPALDDVLFALPLDGVSDPLEFGNTYTVSRVTEIHPARPRPFAEVQSTVRVRMTTAHADSLLDERLAVAREKYPVEVDWEVIQRTRLDPPQTAEDGRLQP